MTALLCHEQPLASADCPEGVSLPPRKIGSIQAKAMLDTLVEMSQTLNDEEAVEVFVGTFQVVINKVMETGEDEAGSQLLQGFCDVIGVTLRRWAAQEAATKSAMSLVPKHSEAGISGMVNDFKVDLAELVRDVVDAGSDASVVDELLDSAATDMAVAMLTAMEEACSAGIDIGRAEDLAEAGRLQ